jgi:hypothetical protein
LPSEAPKLRWKGHTHILCKIFGVLTASSKAIAQPEYAVIYACKQRRERGRIPLTSGKSKFLICDIHTHNIILDASTAELLGNL